MPFFSLLDPRAKPKGSRDPLGFELIWTRFGRQLVGNLTTITSSVENFSVALLGFYWANELAASEKGQDRHAAIRNAFLRYEQVAGYLRYAYASQTRKADSNSVMGINRVRDTYRSERRDIDIGPEYPILSDQASYGLWGLYSAALRMTHLVDGDDRVPTEVGRRLAGLMAESMIPKTRSFIRDCMRSGGRDLITKDEVEEHASSFHSAIEEPVARRELFAVLLRGQAQHASPNPVQDQLFAFVRTLAAGDGRLPGSTPEFIKMASSETQSAEMTEALSAIKQVERLLVTVNRLFDFLRTQNGVEIARVAQAIKGKKYDFSFLPEYLPRVPGGGKVKLANRARLQSIGGHLRRNEIKEALVGIVSLNDEVMQKRSGSTGSGWIYVEGDRFKVRRPREAFDLDKVDQKALETKWDYNYFLDSFLSIARQNRHLLEVAQ